MARIAAIDWDRYEARLVVARTHGLDVEIEAAASVPLAGGEGAALGPEEIGLALRPLVAEYRASHAITLVGVDRASVELLSLRLPPATDAELPFLVANEATRQSQVMSDQAVVDFVPLDDNPAEGRRVSVAVLGAQRLGEIRQTCQAAGLTPNRLLLRPLAAASLFSRLIAPVGETCLLVSPLADEADMTILVRGRPVYWRTARVPPATGPDELAERLLVEIRRTLAVAGQDVETPVEHVYLIAAGAEQEDLCQRVREDLELPADGFDPLAMLNVGVKAAAASAGRFAAALGMALDEAHGAAHAMDFLHPRRPRRQLTRTKQVLVGAAAALLLAAALGGIVWRQLATLDAENAKLADDLKDLDGLTSRAAQQRRLVESLREWQSGDIHWLEELRELSERFPPASDAVVVHMSITGSPSGGHIAFPGMVSDPAQIARMEYGLRDANHGVRSRRIQENARQDQQYTCLFEMDINVANHREEPPKGKK